MVIIGKNTIISYSPTQISCLMSLSCYFFFLGMHWIA